MTFAKFFIFGVSFSIVLIKVEAISWFRIQEMFYFQSFHMYGVLLSGIGVAMVGFWLIKKVGKIEISPKPLQPFANVIGGVLFGLGWGITGACSGPVYALIGLNVWPALIVLAGALIGTVIYGYLRKYLPH